MHLSHNTERGAVATDAGSQLSKDALKTAKSIIESSVASARYRSRFGTVVREGDECVGCVL